MSKFNELHTVNGARVHNEICRTEQTLRSHWLARYAELQDKRFAQKVGAIPRKSKWEHSLPQTASGPYGKQLAYFTQDKLDTMSLKQYDAYLTQTSKLWDVVGRGSLSSKPFNKRPMPTYYGRTLHTSSRDGTDHSSRAH